MGEEKNNCSSCFLGIFILVRFVLFLLMVWFVRRGYVYSTRVLNELLKYLTKQQFLLSSWPQFYFCCTYLYLPIVCAAAHKRRKLVAVAVAVAVVVVVIVVVLLNWPLSSLLFSSVRFRMNFIHS